MPVNPKRVRSLVVREEKKGPVVYWMSRDQRSKDNWALLFARELALKSNSPLAVAFCLVPEFLGATSRQYRFMLEGLKEAERNLLALEIPFFLLWGDPGIEIMRFCEENDAGALVTEFDPLRPKRQWKRQLAEQIEIPFWEVDSHNIVPCWLASPKQEWAAYSFRPRIHRLLAQFLEEFPLLGRHPVPWEGSVENDWAEAEKSIRADSIQDVSWIRAGEAAAAKHLGYFIAKRLSSYDAQRNDPVIDGQSGLSPYLHFGQLSAERAALDVIASMQEADAFTEELVVRRELADNFCYYNPGYDDVEGFPGWAKKTLEEHSKDRREYLYTLAELEKARTHDDLWNAAQLEMVAKGKMHGYLRMYWAKKILEWTESPAEAMKAAIYLNDRYEMDGRDPNGYTGIAWSIGGVHDRAWKERQIFGKIRYMSYQGASHKFDIAAYIRKVQEIESSSSSASPWNQKS